MSEREINQKVAVEIRSTYLLNGQQFHLGDWIGLLDGKVVAVEKDLTAVAEALRTLGGNAQRGMILQVGPPQIDCLRGPYLNSL